MCYEGEILDLEWGENNGKRGNRVSENESEGDKVSEIDNGVHREKCEQ